MDNRICLFSVFILSTFFSCSTCFAYLLTEEHFSTNVVRSKVLSVVTNQVEGGFSVVSTVERHWQRNERNGSENLRYFDTFRVVAETPAGRQKLIFDSEPIGQNAETRRNPPLFHMLDVLRDQDNRLLILYTHTPGIDVAVAFYLIEVWNITPQNELQKAYSAELFELFNSTLGARFYVDQKGLPYVVTYVARNRSIQFWRIGESEAIREKYSPIPVPAEWQSMTNRVISVSTNHLSGGYSFVAKAERNYRCKRIYSWGRNENESGLENRTQTNTNDSFATGYPIVTGTDRYTWTILGLDDRIIETSADERLYYSAQGLFWSHADTEPDRILDVYRNDKGIIYLANERFDGFTVWTYKHEWDLLNVETVFGPSFRKPVAGATFHPIGESLYLQIDFENGTTDYWKIDGQDAEKLQEPPPGLKKRPSHTSREVQDEKIIRFMP